MNNKPFFKSRKSGNGLTLVELLVVIAVITILATVGYPAYTDQVRKVRRYDAEGVLMALANVMEQDLAKTPNTGYGINDISPYSSMWSSLDNYYTFSVNNPDAFSYTLSAAPKGAQGSDSCGTLSLNQEGTKGPATANCWK